MKITILYSMLFCFINMFSQTKKEIYLNTINDSLMQNMVKQGKKLFKKSDCISSEIDNYYVIPEFFVVSKISLDELKFSSKDSLLSNLSFVRESKRRLLKYVTFNAVHKKLLNSYSSDCKRFYCQPDKIPNYLLSANENIKINTVKYIFGISGTNIFLNFIVNNEDQIFVHLNGLENKWMTLSDFNDFYQKGLIENFSDKLIK